MVHTKTETAIKGIEETLRAIKSERDRFGEELKKVNALDREMYVEGYIEKRRETIKADFAEYCRSRAGTLEGYAKNTIEAERELEALPLNVNDTTFTNALALVNSMGNALPLNQQEEIAKQFSGNYAAEKCLQALYVKLGLAYVIQLTNADTLTGNLYGAVAEFNYASDTPIIKTDMRFRKIERAANEMLEKFNSTYKMDLGVKEGAQMEMIHAAAGLSMTY